MPFKVIFPRCLKHCIKQPWAFLSLLIARLLPVINLIKACYSPSFSTLLLHNILFSFRMFYESGILTPLSPHPLFEKSIFNASKTCDNFYFILFSFLFHAIILFSLAGFVRALKHLLAPRATILLFLIVNLICFLPIFFPLRTPTLLIFVDF